jgi:hypothetical protein
MDLDKISWMGGLGFRAIIHKKNSSLDLELQVYGLST